MTLAQKKQDRTPEKGAKGHPLYKEAAKTTIRSTSEMIGDGGDNNKIHGMEQDSAGSGADVGRTPQAGKPPSGRFSDGGEYTNSTQQRQEQPPCGYSGYAPYGYGGNPL